MKNGVKYIPAAAYNGVRMVYIEGPCLMQLLVLEKIRISQNSHLPNICLMRIFGYSISLVQFFLAIFAQKIALMK